MVAASTEQTQEVVVLVRGQLYGIEIEHVREMFEIPKLTAMPRVPEFVRGVVNLRGRVLPVLDLRMKLGMPRLSDEHEALFQMLKDREQDHKNWIAELESSVEERRPFKLQTDPHLCAFGKWYDMFSHPSRLVAAFLVHPH